MKAASTWPVNSAGEIVVQAGTGSSTIVGYMPNDQVPVDDASGAVVMKLPAGSGGGVSAVNATAPLSSSGGTSPTISVPAATSGNDGYMTAAQAATVAQTSAQATTEAPTIAGNALSITTSATPTGGAFVLFGSQACTALRLTADKVALEYQRNATGAVHLIEAGETKTILGITNANQIGVRRRDYATANVTTQVTTVVAEPLNTSVTYTVTNLLVTNPTGSAYTAFASTVCTSLWLINRSRVDILYQTNSSGVVRELKRGKGVWIDGITNANQVSLKAFDNQGAAVLAEAYNGRRPHFATHYDLAQEISPTAIIRTGDVSGGNMDMDIEMATMIANFSPFTRWTARGRSLARYDVAANVTLVGSGITVADVAPTESAKQTTQNPLNSSSQRLAVRATWGGNNTGVFKSSIGGQPTGIDVTGGYIFNGSKLVTGTPTAVEIRLYNDTLNSGSDSIYYSLAVVTDLNNGLANIYGHNARSFPVSKFTSVGGAAAGTLTAVNRAALVVTGPTGLVVQLEDIKFVQPAFDRAHFYISFDDTFASSLRDIEKTMSTYGFPGCFYFSPMASTLGNGGGDKIHPTDALGAQNMKGWQICSQDYRLEGNYDSTALEYKMSIAKTLMIANALGFDCDGIRDGSIFGGGTNNGGEPKIYHADPQFLASIRRFDNSSTTSGDVFPFVDSMPPGDPYNLRCLNASSWAGQGASVVAARWQAYVQQVIDNKGMGFLGFHNDSASAENAAALAIFLPWLYSQVVAGNIYVTTPVRSRRAYAARMQS